MNLVANYFNNSYLGHMSSFISNTDFLTTVFHSNIQSKFESINNFCLVSKQQENRALD